MAIILIATAVLRLAVADHSLWFDEQASLFFSDQPFARLWSDWMLRETNPPLYYSILRAWRSIGASSDWAVRVPSIIASLVALAMIFALTRRIYGQAAALAAAALVAVSAEHLYFAEQARSYIFVMCAALIAVDALVTLAAPDATRTAQRRAMIVYTCAATAAIYLHTTMILFPAVALVAVIVAEPARYRARPRLLVPLLAANLAVLALSAWAIRAAVLQLLYHRDNIAAVGLVGPRRIIEIWLETLFLASGTSVLAYIIAIPSLMLTIGFAAIDRHNRQTRLLAALAGISLLVLTGLGMFVPVLVHRTVFWISGILTVLSAAAIVRLPGMRLRWIVFSILTIGLAVNLALTVSKLQEEDWNTPVRVISSHPGALLLVQGEAMAAMADLACRRVVSAPCPYTIVAVTDAADRYDQWGAGLFLGPKVPITELGAYAAGRTVFLFRKHSFHNLPDMLHARGLAAGVPDNGPPFLGPLPASALVARPNG